MVSQKFTQNNTWCISHTMYLTQSLLCYMQLIVIVDCAVPTMWAVVIYGFEGIKITTRPWNVTIIPFITRWHCANLFQPIKGFHFLRLYRVKWAICEDRCLYMSIKVKARFSTQTNLNTPCDDLSRIPVGSYIIVVF